MVNEKEYLDIFEDFLIWLNSHNNLEMNSYIRYVKSRKRGLIECEDDEKKATIMLSIPDSLRRRLSEQENFYLELHDRAELFFKMLKEIATK
jgi:hypothetical protein